MACAALVLGLHSGRAAAQGTPAEPRFDILEFVVVGDTLLGTAAIERAVYGFLGLQRSVADAEGARKALEKAYQDAGFLSVNVVLPPQRVAEAGGEVRLQVVQAAVDKLRVTGADYTLPSQLREAVPSLAPGTVPNFNEMQQELGALARTSADREVTPIIAAGEQPGTMAVELKVQDKPPLHGSVELNNKQSPNTQAGRLEAALSYDNLFQAGHSLGANWFYSPRRPNEANIQSLTYHLPLGGPGDRLFFSYLHSDSNTPTPLGGATVSRGTTLRLRWRDELSAPEGVSQALTWGITSRNLRDANRDVAGFDTPAPALRYPSFNLSYELDLTGLALGNAPARSTRLQADLTASFAGLSRRTVDCFGTPKDQFECKRSKAVPGFQVWGLSLTHREPFGNWLVVARLQGQASDSPLVPAEQVVYGGQDSVRGYLEGEYAGDIGAAARVELLAPPWLPTGSLTVRGLGFADRATLRRLEPLPSEVQSRQLGSSGLGLRVESRIGLQAALYRSFVWRETQRTQRWDFTLRQAF